MPFPVFAAGGFDLVIGILVFTAMMLAAYFFLRRFSKSTLLGGRSVKILERLPLSKDSSIFVVSLEGRRFAVIAGKDGGNLLCELTPNETSPPAAVHTPKDTQLPGFTKRFFHNLKLNLGILPKGTPAMTPRKPDAPSGGETAFAEMLADIAKAQITPASQSAPAVRRIIEPPPIVQQPKTPVTASSYTDAVDNMRRLAQLQAPSVQTPSRQPEAPAAIDMPATELSSHNKQQSTDDQIDFIFDKIALRRQRYNKH